MQVGDVGKVERPVHGVNLARRDVCKGESMLSKMHDMRAWALHATGRTSGRSKWALGLGTRVWPKK